MKRSELDIKKNKGQVKCVCPSCLNDRSDKKDKALSVNLDTGHYKCHYCGTKGILDEYRKTSHFTQEEKTFTLPPVNQTGLGTDQQNYLFSRGISMTSVNRNKITQSPKGWLEFNYFEFGQLVNVKYRSINDKKFMQHKGGKPILYGLDDIIGETTIIIVEGEIDKLSIEEAGFTNCVSVPMGAMNANDESIDGKLKCFEYAADYFTNSTEIIIAVDNDNNGKRLKEEIARRFGKHRCKWVDFGDCKDANEVLTGYGSDYLHNLIIQAKPFPIDGVIYVADFVEKIHDLYINGFATAFSMGMGMELDKLLKIAPGFLTVVTGAPTSGKSNFIENVAYNLMRDNKWKFASYSPEHPEELAFQRFARMKQNRPFFEGQMQRMDRKELIDSVTFFQDHLYFVRHKMNNNIDTLLGTFEQLVFKHGINAAIIDPWTDVEHDMAGNSETVYVASSLSKIKDFARGYDVHVFLIAHPTKPRKGADGEYIKPTLYDISGSANFYNKADNGMIIHRNHADNTVSVDIKKVKFEGIHGQQGSCEFTYDRISCTYSPAVKSNQSYVEF